jgi:hypothetical protein
MEKAETIDGLFGYLAYHGQRDPRVKELCDLYRSERQEGQNSKSLGAFLIQNMDVYLVHEYTVAYSNFEVPEFAKDKEKEKEKEKDEEEKKEEKKEEFPLSTIVGYLALHGLQDYRLKKLCDFYTESGGQATYGISLGAFLLRNMNVSLLNDYNSSFRQGIEPKKVKEPTVEEINENNRITEENSEICESIKNLKLFLGKNGFSFKGKKKMVTKKKSHTVFIKKKEQILILKVIKRKKVVLSLTSEGPDMCQYICGLVKVVIMDDFPNINFE